LAPEKLKQALKGYGWNRNPRCAFPIEAVFSGSPKQILVDITNASMMGYYGVVIPSPEEEAKAKRVFEYAITVRNARKAPVDLFRNVRIIPQNEFLRLLS
jgi:hypothetical protein